MEQKQENLNDTSPGTSDDQAQADSNSKVREGQEDSSILHDKKDPDKEILDVTKKDISSVLEEFINDVENTRKKEER